MSLRQAHLLLLLLAALLLRWGCHETYLPWWAGDSPGYSGPAASMYHGQWADYIGGRTPTYPLFLLGCEILAGAHVQVEPTPHAGQVIAWAQTLFGLVSVMLVYLTMERLAIRPWIRFALALFYALTAVVARFEMLVLSESVCLFFIALSVYGMARTMELVREGKTSQHAALLAGTASGLAVLARPNVMFIWLLWIGLFSLYAGWAAWRSRRAIAVGILKATAACAGSGALLIAGWLVFNYENNFNFELTPVTEMTRATAAYNLFDRVHPKDRLLGEIMTRYYRETNPPGAFKPDYVWAALPELWNRYADLPIHAPRDRLASVHLAHYLGRVSNYLLLENPGTWLENSCTNFATTREFYLGVPPPGYVGNDPISLDGHRVIVSAPRWAVLDAAERWEAWPLLTIYLLTFASVLIGGLRAFQKTKFSDSMPDLLIVALSGGAILCLVLPCILATYSSRYSVPVIPVFVVSSAYVLEVPCRWFGSRRTGNNQPASPQAAVSKWGTTS